MGDNADMVLDGFLDWNGEYTGNHNSGYNHADNAQMHVSIKSVRNMFTSHADELGKNFKIRDFFFKHLLRYGLTIGKYSANSTCKHILLAPANKKAFHNWINEEFKST